MLKVSQFPERFHDPFIQKKGYKANYNRFKKRKSSSKFNLWEKGLPSFSTFFSFGGITKLFKNKFLKVKSKVGD